MLSAIDWELHARQTRGLAERLARFGDAGLARHLAAAADLLDCRSAILRSRAQGGAEVHVLSALRRRRDPDRGRRADRAAMSGEVMPLAAR
jgi:hypothetical protein